MVVECETVSSQMNRKLPPEAPLYPWEWPHKLDYAGPFLSKMFLMVVDAHSKWIEAFPMNTSASNATIEKNCLFYPWPSFNRACRKSFPNLQGGNEEVEGWKFGNQTITFSKQIPNHSSDDNWSLTCKITARQKTKIKIGSSLPRNWSESTLLTNVTEAEARFTC